MVTWVSGIRFQTESYSSVLACNKRKSKDIEGLSIVYFRNACKNDSPALTAVLTPVCTPDLMDLNKELNSEPISRLTSFLTPPTAAAG